VFADFSRHRPVTTSFHRRTQYFASIRTTYTFAVIEKTSLYKSDHLATRHEHALPNQVVRKPSLPHGTPGRVTQTQPNFQLTHRIQLAFTNNTFANPSHNAPFLTCTRSTVPTAQFDIERPEYPQVSRLQY